MAQQQVHAKVRPTQDSDQRDSEVDAIVDQAVADAATRLAEDAEVLATTDALLDEIDEILQQEEEFAVVYRQRGGQ